MIARRLRPLLAACAAAPVFVLAMLAAVQAAPEQPHAPHWPPAGFSVRFVTAAALPDVLAVSTDGFYRSEPWVHWSNDGGKGWRQLLTMPAGLLLPTNLAVTPRPDPTRPLRFLVGDNYTLYRTGDFGLTWAVSFSQTAALLPPPATCSLDLQASQAEGEVLYLAANCYTMVSPRQPAQQAPVAARSAAASSGAESGRYVSRDGGVTWQKLPDAIRLPVPVPLVLSPVVPGRVLYFIDNDLMQSDDYGFTWRRSPTAWPPASLLLPDRVEPDTLYAVETTDAERYLISTDNGLTWRDWASVPCEDFSKLQSTGSRQLWGWCAGEPAGQWYFSADGGDSWGERDPAPGAASDFSVLPDYGHPGHALLLDKTDRLWRSIDGGAPVLISAGFPAPVYWYVYLPGVRK